jgi:anti-anti-sigma factor
MDSTGIYVILNAVSLLGERGRVVIYSPSPMVRRLIDICGLDGMIDINDDPAPPGLTEQRSSPADDPR